ncbi:homoserine O-acetyltransferase [Dichomitus squalens LYAD-421 SS1]|uniref:Homoserine O-acetyltransferase n=1 Tax=Dichomitus squalens (strain LYAD-421) TaxID=732165 RepID=R7SNC1_DICSQ|nr:homoserine O-acetyltransferase [Dichomitus squalens LYAD-421 SS1]EJF57664.1 homoserine O-acetyltransferase [Dichomitus squalens LYAD-421 SS1]
MSQSRGIQYYRHGRFRVAGGMLPDAITAYSTYGDPTNPCIVFPTCYGGRLDSQDYMIGEDKALDPTKYYIVTFALFSNGEPPPYNGPYFPAVSYEDNIRAQYAVLTKELNVKKVYCVIGFSMGGQQTADFFQAYYWPVIYPDFVEKYIPICGSARTSMHNKCFIEGPKSALLNSKDFENGHYTKEPQFGIRAFGRAYSAWAYGQTWFREHGYLMDGRYSSLEDFLRVDWEGGFLGTWDANDMITLINTWQDGDVTLVGKSSFRAAHDDDGFASVLRGIKAKGLIMPCKTDLYFPPEDSEIEVSHLGDNAKLVVIDSVWGHMAGGGANARDDDFIKTEVRKFLEN